MLVMSIKGYSTQKKTWTLSFTDLCSKRLNFMVGDSTVGLSRIS
uniref:Uncharacterized protein n=1 Tax=Anguilla anguilla TaxID=7936 RepID=A0A0E9R256_ANGAN